MQTRSLSDGSTLYWDDRGACCLRLSNNGAILATCAGVQVADLAPIVIRQGIEAIAKYGRAVFLVDALDSPRMDTEFREQVPKWMAAQRGKATAHLLLRSKMIEMAISLANLFQQMTIGRGYTNVSEWEKIGATELGPGFKRTPLAELTDVSFLKSGKR